MQDGADGSASGSYSEGRRFKSGSCTLFDMKNSIISALINGAPRYRTSSGWGRLKQAKKFRECEALAMRDDMRADGLKAVEVFDAD